MGAGKTTNDVVAHRLRVTDADAGKRVDRFLAETVPGLSRRRARFLLDAGSVWVDGHRTRIASRPLRAGQEIECHVQTLAVGPTEAFDLDRIVHEDAGILAIDKPAGIPSHPTRARQQGTALQLAEELLRRRAGRKVPLWPLHRLDTGTSGLLLFARSRDAARAMNDAFASRRVDKIYLAVVSGSPTWEEKTVTSRLVEGHLETTIGDVGKEAETRLRVVRRAGARSLVEIEPRTGRMHQIRVHLASLGHPVVGDTRYGREVGEASRLLLHASSLRFPHPEDGRLVELAAPLPEAFELGLPG